MKNKKQVISGVFKDVIRPRAWLLVTVLMVMIVFAGSMAYKYAAPNLRFRSFTKELFKSEVASNALTLHYTLSDPRKYGIREYEKTLGSISEKNCIHEAVSIENLTTTLRGLEHPLLNKENQLTYDILSYYLGNRYEMLDYYLYPEIFSPGQGIQSQLPIVLAEYEFRGKQDIEDYLELLSSLDIYFAEAIRFEKVRAQNELCMSDFACRNVVEQCESFLADDFLVTSFDRRLKELSFLNETEKKDYSQKNQSALKNHVVPAYEELVLAMNELKDTAPRSMALCTYPNGREYYQMLIRDETGSDKTIPELKKWMQLQFTDQYMAYHELMSGESLMPANTAGERFGQEPERMLEDLKQKIATDFPSLPDTEYDIKYVEEELQDFMSPAFYMTPTIDGTDTNVIYINPKLSYSPLSLYTTLAHEGYPGHLYQTNYYNRLHTDPLRSLLNFGGYTEGWALYVEMYSYRLFDASTDKAVNTDSGKISAELSIERLNHLIQLCLFSLLDIGIHYDGLSEADVIQNLARFGITDTETARGIYEYISEEPGIYLKYYVGYLEILQLRNEVKLQKSKDFQLMDFHRSLLEVGPAPFPIIREHITASIDKDTEEKDLHKR